MDQVFRQLLAVQVLLLLVSAACANTLYFQPSTDSVVCPDNKHTCNSDTTCCILPNGQYGCCMYANAVCCSDNIHCCPTGSYCDVNTGSCDKGGIKFEWSKKSPAALYIPKEKVESHLPWIESIPPMETELHQQQPESIPWAEKLPGLKINPLNISSFLNSPSSCSVSKTLCKSDSGLSGCCPFPNAVCCDKGQMCCPSGFQCNLKSSKCEKPTEETPIEITELQPVHTLFELRDPTVCPDGVTVCPTDSTCCLVGKTSYACCPYPKATCCSDHQHCCPNDYTCDLAAGECVKKQVDLILVKMVKWQAGQVCPDMETTCPEGSTCCPLHGGRYGCCPYPKATCCTDGQHCCPNGYQCDLKESKCIRHKSQIQSAVQSIVCPDQITRCPSSSTCCKLIDGSYGCCPYAKATCCKDDLHCCPHGYTCDVKAGMCHRKSVGSTEMSLSLSVIQKSATVTCPDMSHCSGGSTCCLSGGRYGCCPIPQAKCCSDQKHCCPENFICDPVMGRCRIETRAKLVSLTSLSVANVTYSCPDSQCPTGSTCCPISSRRFGCCPLPKAVCCHDDKHCCPKNYHCDLEHKRCVMGQTSLPLFKKSLSSKPLIAMEPPKKPIKSVMCPDYNECPDHNTCCLMDTGAWGCCPYLNAVCCIDRKHCCPKTYFCDMKHSKCVSSKTSINPIVSMIYSKIKPAK